jgi:chloramphenicol 3-O phosphotransferase
MGIDDVLSKIPAEWKSAGPDRGPFAEDGIRFEMTADGPGVRVGNLGRQMLRAYQAGVAAAAHVGLNVIVDEVVIDRTSWDDWNVALAGLEVVWVGVRCSPEVAEERNRARGDRFAGLARALTATVHRDATYAFEIDTTTQTQGSSAFTTHTSTRVLSQLSGLSLNDVTTTDSSVLDAALRPTIACFSGAFPSASRDGPGAGGSTAVDPPLPTAHEEMDPSPS